MRHRISASRALWCAGAAALAAGRLAPGAALLSAGPVVEAAPQDRNQQLYHALQREPGDPDVVAPRAFRVRHHSAAHVTGKTSGAVT